ncbi:hypothetical protein ACRALDRAFT_2059766 [Sodiomyces alcalophilus JCM 7366]|uniref:uncharacterized protein n=1 Tax=Sodiomyces alcalophilus JCM 7366 TaxID=591952 RepID=UPI0039B3E661
MAGFGGAEAFWKLLNMGREALKPPGPWRWIPPEEKRELLGADFQDINDDTQGNAAEGGAGSGVKATEPCVGCLSSREPEFKLPCGHWWCAVCLRDCIRVGLRSPAMWPPRCCRPLTEEVVAWVRCPGWVEIWRQVREEETTPANQRVYCSQGRCADFIPTRGYARRQWYRGKGGTDNGGDDGGADSRNSQATSGGGDLVECLACGERTCRKCRAAAHPGRPCTIEEEDEMLMDLMDKNNFCSCPECHRIVELRDGCNHVKYACDDDDPFHSHVESRRWSGLRKLT